MAPANHSHQRDASQATVGVALCTFNGAAYVGEQLASIAKQTRRIDRILVSDDGSSDDTLAIVRSALASSRIDHTVLTEGRLGITQNFARAVAHCGTDIVFLCDQDDVWLPHKVQTIVTAFEHHPDALLVFSDARLVDAGLSDLGRSQFDMVRMSPWLRKSLAGPKAFETLLRRNVVTGATVAFRRQLLKDALPFVDGWLHDEWLAIIAAARGGLRCVDDALVLYRQHGRNQCGMRPESLGEQLAGAARTRATDTGTRRLQALADRLRTINAAAASEQLRWLRSATDFSRWREELHTQRWRRVGSVAFRLLTGDYVRHADGIRSAAKDILAIR